MNGDLDVTGPKQTVLVTSRSEINQLGREIIRDNVVAVDWHCRVSVNPELYIISIGKQRFSYQIISESKVFIVNFMPFRFADKVAACGSVSGKYVDKFEKVGLQKEEADKVDCPRIKEAVSYLECELIQEIEAGNHIIFIGRVIHKGMDKEEPRVFHITKDKFTTTK